MRMLIWASLFACGIRDLFACCASFDVLISVVPSENVPVDICAKRRFRSACAFAQYDQNLLWTHLIAKDAKCLHADFMRKRSLISVFVGRTCQKVGYVSTVQVGIFAILEWLVSDNTITARQLTLQRCIPFLGRLFTIDPYYRNAKISLR